MQEEYDESVEEEITLCSEELASLDDIRSIDYVGRNNQTTLWMWFNPEEQSYWNKYTCQYETYTQAYNFISITPTIDEDYNEFPNEQRAIDNEIKLRIEINDWHYALPNLTGLFPSVKIGNYYGYIYESDKLDIIDLDKEYEDEMYECEGIIFATVKKEEWDMVIKEKMESQKIRQMTSFC